MGRQEKTPDPVSIFLDALHVASVFTYQAASGLNVHFMTANVRQRKAAEMLAINLIWVEPGFRS